MIFLKIFKAFYPLIKPPLNRELWEQVNLALWLPVRTMEKKQPSKQETVTRDAQYLKIHIFISYQVNTRIDQEDA